MLMAFVSCLSGCDRQEDGNSTDIKEKTSLSVKVVSVTDTGTRSTLSLTSGSIGLFCIARNNYPEQNNIQYTYYTSAASWEGTSSLIYLNNQPAILSSYYPYNASFSNAMAIPLTSGIYSAKNDLCYATATLSGDNGAVSFYMVHAYALLNIKISRGSYSGNCSISNISIMNAGIRTSAYLNIIGGTSDYEVFGTVSVNPGIATIAEGGSKTITLLMVPTGTIGNLSIKLAIDAAHRIVNVPLASSSLENGKSYTVNLSLK